MEVGLEGEYGALVGSRESAKFCTGLLGTGEVESARAPLCAASDVDSDLEEGKAPEKEARPVRTIRPGPCDGGGEWDSDGLVGGVGRPRRIGATDSPLVGRAGSCGAAEESTDENLEDDAPAWSADDAREGIGSASPYLCKRQMSW